MHHQPSVGLFDGYCCCLVVGQTDVELCSMRRITNVHLNATVFHYLVVTCAANRALYIIQLLTLQKCDSKLTLQTIHRAVN